MTSRTIVLLVALLFVWATPAWGDAICNFAAVTSNSIIDTQFTFINNGPAREWNKTQSSWLSDIANSLAPPCGLIFPEAPSHLAIFRFSLFSTDTKVVHWTWTQRVASAFQPSVRAGMIAVARSEGLG